MSDIGQRDAERVLAEEWVRVLDFASRCAQAVEEGNLYYLYDKAGQLEQAAAALGRRAKQLYDQYSRGDDVTPRARGDAMVAIAKDESRYYRLGRALYGTQRPPSPLDDE